MPKGIEEPNMPPDAQAPLIFFDEVPTAGSKHGVIAVTLAQTLQGIGNYQAVETVTVAAYLRCSLHRAMMLRSALDKAIQLARGQLRPAQTEPLN